MLRPLLVRRAACLAAAATLLGACTSGEDPTAVGTSTEAEPSPTSTWTLRPVVGERTTTTFALGSRPVLGLGTDPEPDQDAIDTVVGQVGDWLDEHLDALQRDGTGLWDEMAAKGLANGRRRRPVTTDLASPDAPVKSARYVISVYHDGAPSYLTARVEVTHPDDSVADVGLVFVVTDDGEPVLTMFGPEPAAEAAE